MAKPSISKTIQDGVEQTNLGGRGIEEVVTTAQPTMIVLARAQCHGEESQAPKSFVNR
jgi:hypothetical protein